MNGSSAYGAAKNYTDEHGGGSGGTKNYNELSNRPSINGRTLEGNMTGEELGLTNKILSIERLGKYIFKATFDGLPPYDSSIETFRKAGCTSFMRDGKMHRNLDFFYDNTSEFLVKTKDYDGMAFIKSMNDGSLDPKKVEQLPYHINDGVNRDGIMVSTHVLFNDWEFYGCGSMNKDITILPYYVLSNLHRMADINSLSDYLSNIKIPDSLKESGYLLQFLVSDGVTTYVICPPENSFGAYVMVDATNNPKLVNFRWINKKVISDRDDVDLQLRPSGIERWNLIESGATLEDLKFTICYESPIRLSEFIGENNTTKESTDAELTTIYNQEHTKYLSRTRDGRTWQTCHSVIYGANGMESLFVQENYEKDYIDKIDTDLFLFTYTDGSTSIEKMIKGA